MTPKEKAQQLIEQYYSVLGGIEPKDWEYFHKENARVCALIAVDEIMIILQRWDAFKFKKSPELIYWQEVKQEIEKL